MEPFKPGDVVEYEGHPRRVVECSELGRALTDMDSSIAWLPTDWSECAHVEIPAGYEACRMEEATAKACRPKSGGDWRFVGGRPINPNLDHYDFIWLREVEFFAIDRSPVSTPAELAASAKAKPGEMFTPRAATWADIRPGAVVRQTRRPHEGARTVMRVYDNGADLGYWAMRKDVVDDGGYTLIRPAPDAPKFDPLALRPCDAVTWSIGKGLSGRFNVDRVTFEDGEYKVWEDDRNAGYTRASDITHVNGTPIAEWVCDVQPERLKHAGQVDPARTSSVPGPEYADGVLQSPTCAHCHAPGPEYVPNDGEPLHYRCLEAYQRGLRQPDPAMLRTSENPDAVEACRATHEGPGTLDPEIRRVLSRTDEQTSAYHTGRAARAVDAAEARDARMANRWMWGAHLDGGVK